MTSLFQDYGWARLKKVEDEMENLENYAMLSLGVIGAVASAYGLYQTFQLSDPNLMTGLTAGVSTLFLLANTCIIKNWRDLSNKLESGLEEG